MRIPEPFTSKSGFTRTAIRGRTPSRSPALMTRATSVADSISMMTPEATACAMLASFLPGPAKLTLAGRIGVSSAVRISDADATSKASTSVARCCVTAGMGLALIA
ncbi:hypothetical protein ABIF20_001488 [Bradyrhizobium japonicum]